MTDTIISERKKDVQYEGQILATIEDLAKAMDLSKSRVRSIVSEIGSPEPVHTGEHVFQGRVPHLYDQKKVLLYFLDTKKQLVQKYLYRKRFIEQGLLNESDFQM